MALSHNNFTNYYKTVFALVQRHKYSISEVENLIPFERDIYVDMLAQLIKELEEKQNK